MLLMTDNCEKFNLENPYFLQYGRRFRKIALNLLDKEEERERSLEKVGRCFATDKHRFTSCAYEGRMM